MNEIYRYYKSLDLEPEASLEEVKKVYRHLVKVWHPDRFPDNQRLQKKANEKLSEINKAYEKITLYISQKDQIVSEERIYEEQSEQDSQERTDSQAFPEVDLISLLGKSKDSIEIKHFISSLNESPAFYHEIFNYEFFYSGITLYFSPPTDILRTLRKIQLFSEVCQELLGYKQYRGSIPGDLKFSDDRQTTRKKLGLPSKSGSWWDEWLFPTYSMRVAYYNRGKIIGKIYWIILNEVGPVKEKGKWWQELWKGPRGEKV